MRCSGDIAAVGGVLCGRCAARLRVLLCARAGVRRRPEQAVTRPYGLAVVLVLAVLGGVARLLVPLNEPAPLPTTGVWRVFASQQFVSPLGMAADGDGNLYVADAGTHKVHKLAADGTVLASWGGRGTGPGQFERPAAVALDSEGNVFVADTANSRIQKLSPSGALVAGGALLWPLGRVSSTARAAWPSIARATSTSAIRATIGSRSCRRSDIRSQRGVEPDKGPANFASRMGSRSTPNATSTWPTTGTIGFRSSRRLASRWRSGACTALAPASSTIRAVSRSIAAATSSSPTATTTASRSLGSTVTRSASGALEAGRWVSSAAPRAWLSTSGEDSSWSMRQCPPTAYVRR
jgi:hypothetical protein